MRMKVLMADCHVTRVLLSSALMKLGRMKGLRNAFGASQRRHLHSFPAARCSSLFFMKPQLQKSLEHHRASSRVPKIAAAATWILSAALFAMLACGCDRAPQRELRLAINPWPGYEFLYLAKEKGFLAEENLNVRLLEYASLSDCRVAFESGQVDAMACSLIEVLQARENSHRTAKIILATDFSDGADVILGRANFASLPALKGHRVGLELGSLGGFMLGRALELQGMKLSDVELVSCTPDTLEAALANGDIDAAVTYPPASVHLEAGGQMHRLFSSAEIPGEVVDVVAVDAPVLERDPELPARFSRAQQRAQEYSRAHPQEAYTLMGRREAISAAEFEQALKGIHLVDVAEQQAFFGPKGSLLRSLADVDRTLRSTGQLHKSSIAAVADLLPPVAASSQKQN
jgi:NitT/TauT family transport system substrate-binding protein